MHIISTSAHQMHVDIRPSGQQVREVFVEGDLECRSSPPISNITLLDQPGGVPATISGTTITCMEVGRHLFRVEFSDGKSAHLHVLSMAHACRDRIPGLNHGRVVNPSADPKPRERTPEEVALILRSLATHAPLFDGTVASFDRLGNLAQYGA